jgi:hypothetical protein
MISSRNNTQKLIRVRFFTLIDVLSKIQYKFILFFLFKWNSIFDHKSLWSNISMFSYSLSKYLSSQSIWSPYLSFGSAGLLATAKENLFRVSPLRHVEPILFWRGRTFSENPRPYVFLLVSVTRKTRTLAYMIVTFEWEKIHTHWEHMYSDICFSSFQYIFSLACQQYYSWLDSKLESKGKKKLVQLIHSLTFCLFIF